MIEIIVNTNSKNSVKKLSELEKIFARLIINNNEKANIEILMSDDAQQVEEVGHSEEVDKILESNEE